MKRLILLSVTLLLSITAISAQEIVEVTKEEHLNGIELHWEDSYKSALKKAKKQKKKVLVYFTGSDWCGPCKKLDKKLFHTQKFKDFADKHFVLYMADFPRNKDKVSSKKRKVNKELRNKFGQSAFPTLVFVDYRGKMLDYKKGVYMAEYYYPIFKNVVENY